MNMAAIKITNHIKVYVIIILLVFVFCNVSLCEEKGVKKMGTFKVQTEILGPAGTGSKSFISGCLHSNGKIYIGTYGPAPAIIWQFDPKTNELEKLAAPGEYQLRRLVEGVDGKIYIGTAYEGLVYCLDPDTGKVSIVGTPPVDSTTWIFWMFRSRSGKIYGARGVGLFELDVKTGKIRSLGLVPGEHQTPPPSSDPIVRTLHELPDGSLLGDTNRHLFRYFPKESRYEIIADMVKYDNACYAMLLPFVHPSDGTMIFPIYPRYSGKKIAEPFYFWDADSNKVKHIQIKGWGSRDIGGNGWVGRNAQGVKVLRQPSYLNGKFELTEIDIEKQCVIYSYTENPGSVCIDANGVWWLGGAGFGLVRFDEAKRTCVPTVSNPTPAPTRCLAASPDGMLGTDTFDLGHMFTFDPQKRISKSHGKVWADDHRCNYGPAAFSGDGRYFICNHGQATPKLFVTDVEQNSSWSIGKTASSLITCSDGSVWGVEGASVDTVDIFLPPISWTPQNQRQQTPAKVFRYHPGAKEVEVINHDWLFWGYSPLLAELEYDGKVCILAVSPAKSECGWVVLDMNSTNILNRGKMQVPAWSITSDDKKKAAYMIGEDGCLYKLVISQKGDLVQDKVAEDFGTGSRGFFYLPGLASFISIESDGTVNGFSVANGTKFYAKGPVPLPSGPAVDATRNCWYFSGDIIVKYAIQSEKKE